MNATAAMGRERIVGMAYLCKAATGKAATVRFLPRFLGFAREYGFYPRA